MSIQVVFGVLFGTNYYLLLLRHTRAVSTRVLDVHLFQDGGVPNKLPVLASVESLVHAGERVFERPFQK